MHFAKMATRFRNPFQQQIVSGEGFSQRLCKGGSELVGSTGQEGGHSIPNVVKGRLIKGCGQAPAWWFLLLGAPGEL